jgi:hypothetical protein
VGRAQGDDLVDVVGCRPLVAVELGIGGLDRLADDEAAHRVGDDVDLGRLAGRRLLAVGGQLPDEPDQADQRRPVEREPPVVQVVVAEHPDRVADTARRPLDAPPHPVVEHQAFGEEPLQCLQVLGQLLVALFRAVVGDDVGGVLVLPVRLQQPEDEPLVDVVLAPLLG